jgi:hypothetical protein
MTLRWRGFSFKHITRPLLFWAVLIVLIAGLTGFYIILSEREVPPWDPTSMVLLGQSLAHSGDIRYVDHNNVEIGPYFNPHGFDIRAPQDPQPYSTFPPGFSLILAAAYRLGGLHWLYLVPPLLTASGLLAAGYLGCRLAGAWAAIFTVMLLASSQVVVTFATSLWSDGPSVALLLLGLALYVAAVATGRASLFFVSGLCLGLMILSKFVNVAFVGMITVYHLAMTRGGQRIAGIKWMALGLAPGIVGLMLYQTRAYGAPFANAYRPWGQSQYEFPLFSLKYLFVKAPPPWNDISIQAIAPGLLRDMHAWLVMALVGLIVTRRHQLSWLLASIGLANVTIYAISVFTPRQFINMRYLLPALAMGYLLAAVALAWIITRLHSKIAQIALVLLVVVFCIGSLIHQTIPELISRNTGTSNTIKLVQSTAQAIAPDSVVLAYNLADTFVLYGNRSVLNYRRIKAPDPVARNQLVLDAIDRLLLAGRPVYLVKDDESLFGSIYPDIRRRYLLREVGTPVLAYQLSPVNNGQP